MSGWQAPLVIPPGHWLCASCGGFLPEGRWHDCPYPAGLNVVASKKQDDGGTR